MSGVYFKVKDIDRAQVFYESALGLVTKFRDRAHWCQFDTGNVAFALSSVEEAAQDAVGSTIVFKYHDRDEARARIEAAGGSFKGLRDMGNHGIVLTFADPDRNIFQVLVPPRSTS